MSEGTDQDTHADNFMTMTTKYKLSDPPPVVREDVLIQMCYLGKCLSCYLGFALFFITLYIILTLVAIVMLFMAKPSRDTLTAD